jgi:uncharacterized membrane protein YgdD (TMEM256/DUF423 family)
MNQDRALVVGALLMGLAVALGAFGAHALKDTLVRLGTLDNWHTAVRYQAWHALALILLGVLTLDPARHDLGRRVGWMLPAGTLLFSGSLYGLALEPSATWMGPITPLGGALLIAAWLGFARLGARLVRPSAPTGTGS